SHTPTRTRPHVAAPTVAVAAVCALAIAAAPSTAASITPDQPFTELTQWRAQTSLPAVGTLDPAKSDGCKKHNSYMAQNGHTLTHFEQSGNKGYTPEGDAAGQASVLAMPEGGPRIWEGSVYHRMGL